MIPYIILITKGEDQSFLGACIGPLFHYSDCAERFHTTNPIFLYLGKRSHYQGIRLSCGNMRKY